MINQNLNLIEDFKVTSLLTRLDKGYYALPSLPKQSSNTPSYAKEDKRIKSVIEDWCPFPSPEKPSVEKSEVNQKQIFQRVSMIEERKKRKLNPYTIVRNQTVKTSSNQKIDRYIDKCIVEAINLQKTKMKDQQLHQIYNHIARKWCLPEMDESEAKIWFETLKTDKKVEVVEGKYQLIDVGVIEKEFKKHSPDDTYPTTEEFYQKRKNLN